MTKSRKILVGIIIVLIVVVGAVLLSQKQQPSENPKFTLSVNTWVGFGPFWLAQEKGFFVDEGVDVEIVTLEDTAQRKAAMIKGDIDGLGDTVDLLVLARDEKVPSVAVMEVDVSNGADGILVAEGIQNIQDLRGKKVAVQRNFVSEAFLDYVLQKNGMSPADVQRVDTEAGAAGAAFVSGNVDVAVTFEPWLSKAQERKGGGKVLVSSADEPGVIVDILTINENYLAQNPEVVKKVMRAWFKAVDYWKENPQEANVIMARHYDVPPEEFADIISGLIWPSHEENIAYFGTLTSPGRISEVANIFVDVFLKTGQIKSRPDMTKAINSQLLRELYE